MQLAVKQLELSEWLEQYPTLQQAHTTIRAHQNPEYLRRLDHFGQQCLARLDHLPAVERIFGTDLIVGIDLLFEAVQSIDDVPQLFNAIHVPASLTEARTDLAQLWYGSNDLLTAVRLELTHVMILGYEQLALFNPNLADRWLKLYQHTVLTYLRQQADQTSLSLSNDVSCVCASFEWAVDHYTTRFDETGALPLYLLGVIPFSPYVSNDLLDALIEVLPALSQLLRLAQDVIYDPHESLNTGIFAYACERKLTFAQAAQAIHPSTSLQQDISDRLAYSYYQLLNQTEDFIQTVDYADTDWLMDFCRDIMHTSRAMTRKWKPC